MLTCFGLPFVLVMAFVGAWHFFGRRTRRFFRRCRFPRRRGQVPVAVGKRFRPAPPKRSSGRPKPPWVREAVLDLHAEGYVGCRKLAAAFNRLHAAAGMSVGKTWVGEVLTRYHYEADRIRLATRNDIPRPLPANRRWGLDCTGKADGSGQVHAVLGIVDHGTRLNLALTALEKSNTWTILGHTFLAIGRFGKPHSIRTDNAAVFHSRLFQAVLKAAGIRHEFTGLGKPWRTAASRDSF